MKEFEKNSRVVFIGDSITYANHYISRIFLHYLKFFPERRVRFINAGISGGTVSSALRTFDDAMSKAPTHAVITLGVNDSGFYLLNEPRSDERDEKLKDLLDRYVSGMDELIKRLRSRGVETILCTPPPYAEFYNTAKTSVPNGHTLLSVYADRVRRLGEKYRLSVVDYHSRLSEIYLDESIYISDHIHPNSIGHARMAECFLKAQGFDLGEYSPKSIPEPIDPRLNAWRLAVRKYRMPYDVEWMVYTHIGDSDRVERVRFLEEYLENKRYGDVFYYKTAAKAYLKNDDVNALFKAVEAEEDRLYK